ncbi:hypothetical protein [Roseovarius sp. 2305UL8-3]|uniref:hypothetical protein n=1 Tax=Roseovarius conchicola TaxID=3121636 RepID=UPI003529CAA4
MNKDVADTQGRRPGYFARKDRRLPVLEHGTVVGVFFGDIPAEGMQLNGRYGRSAFTINAGHRVASLRENGFTSFGTCDLWFLIIRPDHDGRAADWFYG